MSQPYEEIADPFRRLYRIMKRLQEPNGCPWDLKQTHESLKPYMIEEAYEAVDAIDSGDYAELAEELGDVLLQVLFHSVLAERTHAGFGIDAICEKTAAKMVRRHPHVFGETVAHDAEAVLSNWEKVKVAERQAKGQDTASGDFDPKHSGLAGVPGALPALLRAHRLLDKAERLGLLWTDTPEAKARIAPWQATLEAIPEGDAGEAAFGELLMALAAAGRARGWNAEDALRKAASDFQQRFVAVERAMHEAGTPMGESAAPEVLRRWEDARPA